MPSLREIQTIGLKNPDGSPYVGVVSFQILELFSEGSGTAIPSTSSVTTTALGLFPSGFGILAPDGVGAISYYIELVGLQSSFRNSISAGATPLSFEELVLTATAVGTPNELQALIDIERSERIAADTTLQNNIDTVQSNVNTKDHGTLIGLSDNDHPQYALLAAQNTFTETQEIDNTLNLNEVSYIARSLGTNNTSTNMLELHHRANGAPQVNFGGILPVFLEIADGSEVRAMGLGVDFTDPSAAGNKSRITIFGTRNNARYDFIVIDTNDTAGAGIEQTGLTILFGGSSRRIRVGPAGSGSNAGRRVLEIDN